MDDATRAAVSVRDLRLRITFTADGQLVRCEEDDGFDADIRARIARMRERYAAACPAALRAPTFSVEEMERAMGTGR